MQIVYKRISELIPYENNPRQNDDAVEPLMNSIKEFGFKNPIVVDKNNVIVAGHTRYKAADKLNMEQVPCIVADDLTKEQIKAYRLADNRTSELSNWDFELLEEELSDIVHIDMSDLAFDFKNENELLGAYEELLSDKDYMSMQNAMERDTFVVSFVFPKSDESTVKQYIKKVTKDKIVDMIIEKAKEYTYGD